MKIYIFLKIAVLLFCTFSSTQLNGGIIINGNVKGEKSTITKPNQTTEEIKITAISEIGTYPEFKGLKIILAQLKKNIEVVLRGNKPYRVKTNDENGTVIPARQGNALVLEVTLIPCDEDRRHYFFDAAALIYTSIDPKEEKAVHSKIRTAVMDKATASFAGAEVQEAYPNNINLIGFTGLNTIDPSKEYKLILKFLVGKRVGGYQYIGDDVSDINKANESSNKLLQYTNLSKVYLPNNQLPKLSDDVNNNKLVQNNTSAKNFKSELSNSKPVLIEKSKVESPFYKFLNDADKTLLSKILNSEINFDPKGNGSSSFTKCGQKVGNCKWCGKSSSFTTYYNTVGYLISGANINVQMIPFYFDFMDATDKVQLIKEVKQYINMVRSGKYYSCETNSSEMFCSPKCKFEYKNSR